MFVACRLAGLSALEALCRPQCAAAIRADRAPRNKPVRQWRIYGLSNFTRSGETPEIMMGGAGTSAAIYRFKPGEPSSYAPSRSRPSR
jgi:hypothetical protein